MLRNFGVVIADKLFRCGKYQAKQLKEALHTFHFEQVIYLSDTAPFLSQATYRSLGVCFHHLPVSEYQSVPPAIIKIIMAIDDRTLIHCWKGAHRTGAVVGMLRKEQGWSPRQTWEEMCAFGFGKPDAHMDLYQSVFNAGYFV
jgi:hypothetical protein